MIALRSAAPNDQVTGDTFNHRMYVIENSNPNPMTPEWVEKGQIKTGWESFSLDATVFEHKNQLYYIWAQEDKVLSEKFHSNLYISAMENPWTLTGEPVLLWLERGGHRYLQQAVCNADCSGGRADSLCFGIGQQDWCQARFAAVWLPDLCPDCGQCSIAKLASELQTEMQKFKL